MVNTMVEPITTGAVVAAGAAIARASGSNDGPEKARLLSRVFGKSADSLGDALGRWTDYRLRNVGRIVDAADRRSPGDNAAVAPRIAHRIIEDGSFCDDELMAEYLGGLLATARTPSGRDDRAITWTSLVTQMSVFEIRAHYLIYTELIAQLRSWQERHPGEDVLADMRVIYIDTLELVHRLLELAPEADGTSLLEHAHTGLGRHDLISSLVSGYGPTEAARSQSATLMPIPAEITCHNVMFTAAGTAAIELWGHAHGISADSRTVVEKAGPLIDNPLIPRLEFSYLYAK